MAVRSRLLARQQNLDVGRERPGGLLLAFMFRDGRDELEHAPFDYVRRGNRNGGGDQRSNFGPRPQIRRIRRRRRSMRFRVLPQRCKIGLLPCLADFADIGPGGGGHARNLSRVDNGRNESLDHVHTLSIATAQYALTVCAKASGDGSVRLTVGSVALYCATSHHRRPILPRERNERGRHQMQFGVQFFPAVDHTDKDAADYYAESLAIAEEAERLGFTHARTVEHYFT